MYNNVCEIVYSLVRERFVRCGAAAAAVAVDGGAVVVGARYFSRAARHTLCGGETPSPPVARGLACSFSYSGAGSSTTGTGRSCVVVREFVVLMNVVYNFIFRF